VKRSPIDYVHERFIFTTQPMEEPTNVADLAKMVEMFGYDHLCYSSDYPHWDNDMPENTLRFVPPAERRKIFCENARGFLRLA
jgi:predicted TIM-barrel fold metal-dependent hydrolase